MKITVLGATGQTGQHLVNQALQQGHTVTAVVRNPGKITAHHDNLKVTSLKAVVTHCCSFHIGSKVQKMNPKQQRFLVSKLLLADCDD